MKTPAALLILLSACSHLRAASPDVSNVRVTQRTGTKLVDINYDLSDPDGGPLRVEVQVSSNGGRSYDVPAVTLFEDVGANITPGTNKHVVWDAGKDWPGLFSDQIKVRVFAADNSTPAPPPGMVYVPPGPFQMGDNFAEAGADEGPVHTVVLDGYYVEMYEVTNELWNGVRTWADQHGYTELESESGNVETPVAVNSWGDAIKWCNARSEMEGLTPVYYTSSDFTTVVRGDVHVTNLLTNSCVRWDANGYRLPTEAEWEKAARGGITGNRYPWGNAIDGTLAQYNRSSSSGDQRARVGSYAPNGYGLFDVAGNSDEMCWDRYSNGYYSAGDSTVNPRGPDIGTTRVRRGGDCASPATLVRCADRDYAVWDSISSGQFHWLGATIRCVRVPLATP